MSKNIHIFGGGTVAHITSHFALSAPAYGDTAYRLHKMIMSQQRFSFYRTYLHLTKMAGGAKLETNLDVANKIEGLKKDLQTKIIFFNCALVDFQPDEVNVNNGMKGDYDISQFGKYAGRIESRDSVVTAQFVPSQKIIPTIREGRKDIFLVGFKTTCGASPETMYQKGLDLCKTGSVNLVLVNDVKTRWNMIVTPEEAAYHETADREEALQQLVDMTYYRSQLTFTQSTVVDGQPVAWDSPEVPAALRTVVDYCIKGRAYKPFNGSTVGHFAAKISENEFLTSIRRSNFNDLTKNGLVRIKTSGPDTVLAYGAKPSVGGQSQRIVFKDHPGMDCIVHFHSPLKAQPRDAIETRSQRQYECGSHQCGQNTSSGLKQFGNLKAVMLDQHGPNIVFNRNIDPKEVIDFIEANFDLDKKTGGYNL